MGCIDGKLYCRTEPDEKEEENQKYTSRYWKFTNSNYNPYMKETTKIIPSPILMGKTYNK
jgi:hypothetical protein